MAFLPPAAADSQWSLREGLNLMGPSVIHDEMLKGPHIVQTVTAVMSS